MSVSVGGFARGFLTLFFLGCDAEQSRALMVSILATSASVDGVKSVRTFDKHGQDTKETKQLQATTHIQYRTEFYLYEITGFLLMRLFMVGGLFPVKDPTLSVFLPFSAFSIPPNVPHLLFCLFPKWTLPQNTNFLLPELLCLNCFSALSLEIEESARN